MKFTLKIATVALAAGLLGACTTTFTYNQLDWLIPWYVDGYVDLNGEQRRLLRQQLEPQLQWHRGEELARYIALLDRIESDLSKPPAPERVSGWVDGFVSALERVERSMLAVALEFGATVSDAQMQEFIDSLWEKQREYEDEYLSRSDEEYRRDNYDNLEDLMDRLLGRLSREQKEILREAARELRRFDGLWLEERAAWLQSLEMLLQRNAGWQAGVEQAFGNRQENRTPEYQAVLEGNTAIVTAAAADVLTTMSERQYTHALEEIEELRRKLRKLIEQAQVESQATAT